MEMRKVETGECRDSGMWRLGNVETGESGDWGI